nr:MAG TPA: hypothetical protein [Caudoviricetes sp.]
MCGYFNNYNKRASYTYLPLCYICLHTSYYQ